MNLIKELEAWGNTQVLWEKSIDIDWKRFDEVLSIAKAEQAKEPAQDEGIRVFLSSKLHSIGPNIKCECLRCSLIREALSRHPAPSPVEPSKHYKCPKCHTRFTREYPYKPSDTKEFVPLAVLADRKGAEIKIHTKITAGNSWCNIYETSISELESKTRQYLNGLPDKKGDK